MILNCLVLNEISHDEKELEEFEVMIQSLREDCNFRKTLWSTMLKRCAKSVREQFNAFMQKKGFAGNVKFDFNGGELRIDTATDNTDENSKSKDVRTLSGGERSYVTFCLLMAFTRVV